MVAIVIRPATAQSIALARGQNPNPQPVTLTTVARSRRESDHGSVLVATAHTVGQAFANGIRGLPRMLPPAEMPRMLNAPGETEGCACHATGHVVEKSTQEKRARKPLTEEQRAQKNARERARRMARKAVQA